MTKKQAALLFGAFIIAGLSPFVPMPGTPVVADSRTAAAPAVVATAAPATAPAADAVIMDPTTQKPRVPHDKPPLDKPLSITIKQLGNFDYDAEKGGTIPADVKALSGVTLKTSGYMIPLAQVNNITEFALVPSLTGCCYGQPPGIQHVILVHVPKASPAKYTTDPILVSGKLLVSEKREDGYTISIFELNADTVTPLPVGTVGN